MHTRRELFTRWLDAFREPEEEESPRPPQRPPKPPRSYLPEYVRPPGALPEAEFVATCERCHQCAEACPYDVILPLGPAYGEADGTPAVLPQDKPCHLCEDLPCAAACPSGALRRIPLAEVKMGTARLHTKRCWAIQGQPCDYCVKECPLGERALVWDGDRPRILEDGCTGCGMCVAICPTDPRALSIQPV